MELNISLLHNHVALTKVGKMYLSVFAASSSFLTEHSFHKKETFLISIKDSRNKTCIIKIQSRNFACAKFQANWFETVKIRSDLKLIFDRGVWRNAGKTGKTLGHYCIP